MEQDAAFDKDIFELKALMEERESEENLSESTAEKVHKYLFIRHYGVKCMVTFTRKQSRRGKNTTDILRWYRIVRRMHLTVFVSTGEEKPLNSSLSLANSERLEAGKRTFDFVQNREKQKDYFH